MPTRRIIEAVKRRVWRGMKVLGLYTLWQSTGWTLTILCLAVLGASGLKILITMPPPEVGLFDPLLRPLRLLEWHTMVFLTEHPNFVPIWDRLPVFDPMNPLTLLTPSWVVLMAVGGTGGYLLRKKPKDDAMAASVTNIVYGDVAVLNTGVIKRVESIAAHLTRISSPAAEGMRQAIAHLTRAVAEERTFNDTQRIEALEHLNELARYAALPKEERPLGVGRTIVRALDASLNAAGNVADIWSAWGPTIKAFFGILG